MRYAKSIFLVMLLFASSFAPSVARAEEVALGAPTETEAVSAPAESVDEKLDAQNAQPQSIPEAPANSSAQTPPVAAVKPLSQPSSPTPTPAPTIKSATTTNSTAPTKPPEPITIQPSPVIPRGDVLISAVRVDPQRGFTMLELYNTSDNFVNLGRLSLELRYSTIDEDFVCQVSLHDYLRPKSHLSLTNELSLSGCPAPQASELYDKEIIITQDGSMIEALRPQGSDFDKNPTAVWERKGWTTTSRTGVFAKDFRLRADNTAYSSELYLLPDAPTLQVLEVLPRPALCATADLGAACNSYVKVKNVGERAIDLSLYRLRSGDSNVSDSANNTSSLRGRVEPGAVALITQQASGDRLMLNKEAGTIWFQDAHGLTNYVNTVTPYEKAGNVGNVGRSWAYNQQTGVWQWATPSPDSEENDFTLAAAPGRGSAKKVASLKPCRDDQYRSEETGRCRNVVTTKSLKPCKEGQYRSEETGRCRSIAAAASGLKPCRDDQFRNPETGRCKKIASADDLPKPCKDGWERNPITNRCRKIKTASNTLASYPVQPEITKSASPALWWTIGALIAAGMGYAAWEWRSEIKRGFRSAAHFFRK